MRTRIRSMISRFSSFLAKTPVKDARFLHQIKSMLDKLVTPNEKTWINYRGYEFLVDPSDHLGRQLWTNGEYEPEVEEIIRNHLERGDIAYDIGANMGQFTICMRDAVGKSGIVYAFEPTPKNSNLLKDTIDRNNIYNIKVINKAIGQENGTIELHIEESNTGNSTLYPSQEYDKSVQVDMVPLSNYTDDLKNIKFIKIDVEGAELDVIKTLGDEITKVDYMLIESHYYTEHHRDYDIGKLFTILASNGTIFGLSTAPEYESIKQWQNVQTSDELSKYERIIWVRDGCASKTGQKS